MEINQSISRVLMAGCGQVSNLSIRSAHLDYEITGNALVVAQDAGQCQRARVECVVDPQAATLLDVQVVVEMKG